MRLIALALLSLVSANYFIISDLHYDLDYNPDYGPDCACHKNPLKYHICTPHRSNVTMPLGRRGCDCPLELIASALE